jgi:hypothetical protein
MFRDKANRPHPITKGEPILAAIGNSPATIERRDPEGDVNFVPAYDASWLLDTNFAPKRALVVTAPPSREKGWRADPLSGGFAVRKGEKGAFIGYHSGDAATSIAAGARAVLGQEIRNARGGQYTFTIEATGEGTNAEEFESFLANFACRLVLFRFRDMNKDPREGEELASAEFRPALGKSGQFKVDRFLGSTTPGANFRIGNGLGVAVVVAKKTSGVLSLPKNEVHHAGVRIHSVTLEFSAAPRHDNDLL